MNFPKRIMCFERLFLYMKEEKRKKHPQTSVRNLEPQPSESNPSTIMAKQQPRKHRQPQLPRFTHVKVTNARDVATTRLHTQPLGEKFKYDGGMFFKYECHVSCTFFFHFQGMREK